MSLEALRALCALPGRRIFPVGDNKAPLSSARPDNPRWSWNREPFSDKELVAFHEAGTRLAACPASLGLAVVDVDEGGETACAEIENIVGPALGRVTTRRGFHLLYAAPEDPVRNRRWNTASGSGELRGNTGYVVLWDIEGTAQAVSKVDFACAGNLHRLAAPAAASPAPTAPRKHGLTPDLIDALKALAAHYKPDGPPYPEWITVGQAIHQVTRGSASGLRLWDRWSAAFSNYPGPGEPAPETKWRSFSAGPGGVGAGTLRSMAETTGWREDVAEEFEVLEDAPKEKIRLVTDKRAKTLKRLLDEREIRVRLNVRRDMVELFFPRAGRWEEASDGRIMKLREDLSQEVLYQPEGKKTPTPLVFSKTELFEHLDALAEAHQCDPFLVWAQRTRWDGHARLDTWVETVWTLSQSTDRDLARWASRFVFLGAVWRAMQPGCALDEMPIFVGPGGIGKSKSLAWMFPDDEMDWFADRFDFLDTEQKQAEKLMGAVVAEASEMAGVRRADIGHMKAAISSRGATVRLSYRRNARTYMRRCVIVGTGDNSDLLPNDPNLRRWVPITLAGGKAGTVRAYMSAHREQLWAEALHRYHRGERVHLPPELVQAQARAAAHFRTRDQIVEDYASQSPPPSDPENGASLLDLMRATGCPEHLQRGFGLALKEMGWSSSRPRISGRRSVRWFAPDKWVPIKPEGAENDDGFDDLTDTET